MWRPFFSISESKTGSNSGGLPSVSPDSWPFLPGFLVQWIMSERAGRSVIPVAFWWLSIAGGMILLSYAIYRLDPVFILGQSMGMFIYIRNLWLIYAEKRGALRYSDAE